MAKLAIERQIGQNLFGTKWDELAMSYGPFSKGM